MRHVRREGFRVPFSGDTGYANKIGKVLLVAFEAFQLLALCDAKELGSEGGIRKVLRIPKSAKFF